jgi:hypothetical protein
VCYEVEEGPFSFVYDIVLSTDLMAFIVCNKTANIQMK